MRRVAIRRSDVLRAEYMSEISAFDPSMLVFMDEMGSVKRNAVRDYGYGLREITPVQHPMDC